MRSMGDSLPSLSPFDGDDGPGPNMLGRILSAFDAATSRLTDIVEDLLPGDVALSRGTLELCVKGAVVLTAVAFARSVLSTVLLVGAAALAFYAFSNAEVKVTSSGPRDRRS